MVTKLVEQEWYYIKSMHRGPCRLCSNFKLFCCCSRLLVAIARFPQNNKSGAISLLLLIIKPLCLRFAQLHFSSEQVRCSCLSGRQLLFSSYLPCRDNIASRSRRGSMVRSSCELENSKKVSAREAFRKQLKEHNSALSCCERENLKKELVEAVHKQLKEHNMAIPASLASLSNEEFLRGGCSGVTESDFCVWPPVLVRRRDTPTLKVPDFESFRAKGLKFHRKIMGLQKEECETIAVDALRCGQGATHNRLIYVFPPTAQGYLSARYLDREWTIIQPQQFQDFTGWTLKYASVRNMVEMDPHKKLVNWSTLCSGTERNFNTIRSSLQPASTCEDIISKESTGAQTCEIGTSQRMLSFRHIKGLRRRLGDIKDAELSLETSVTEGMDANYFTSKLEALLQERHMDQVKMYLAETNVREQELRQVFGYNGAHVAKSSSERLRALGVLMSGSSDVPENAGNSFTSRMKNRGIELEMRALQSLVEEIRCATTSEHKLRQLKEEQIESTRKLIAKQEREMMKHVVNIRTESETVLGERMLSKLRLVKSLRSTGAKVSALTNFLSLETMEIAEQVYKEGLQDILAFENDKQTKDLYSELRYKAQQYSWEKENQEQKFKAINEEHKNVVGSLNKQVASLSASLKDFKEAYKCSHECCVCIHELEGFALSSSKLGETSSPKKVYKRACFLPCMHASVCTSCSEEIWRGTRMCPTCQQKLTEIPRVVYF